MGKVISGIKLICNDCGHIWDEDDETQRKCPKCDSKETTQLNITRY